MNFFCKNNQLLSEVKTLQPDVAFLYSLKTSENRSAPISGGTEKQHKAVMG